MNRELKFRAWDIGLQEMIYLDFKNIFECDSQLVGEYYDGGYLMQFTGLLDKNGKKIFEGDIVECFNCLTTEDGYTETPIGREIVIFRNGQFTLEIDSDSGGPGGTSKYLRYCVEVLGNLYEHPELLKNQ